MYLPAHFAESRPQVLRDFVATHPLGLLVTQNRAGGIDANSVPFFLDADDDGDAGRPARPRRAREPALEGGARRRRCPRRLPGPARLRLAGLVSEQGRARQGRADLELRDGAGARPPARDRRQGLAARLRDAPDRPPRRRPRRALGGERRARPTSSRRCSARSSASRSALSSLVGKWKVSQNRAAADRAGVVDGPAARARRPRARRRSERAGRQRLSDAVPRVRGLPEAGDGDRSRRALGAAQSARALRARRGRRRRVRRGAGAAPFEDTIAQRVLACTGCHGKEGRAAPDGYYPRIAGKPAGYLFNQLRNFRDGRRHYELMNGLLALLDDAYLQRDRRPLRLARPAVSAAARAGRRRRRCATPARRWCAAAIRHAACRPATTATARR